MEPSSHLFICSDSNWVIRAFVEWMPIWTQRKMTSSDGKPAAHSKFLLNAWNITKNRKGKINLYKVNAHWKSQEEVSQLNNHVDKMAKEAALLGPEHCWTKSDNEAYQDQLQKIPFHKQADLKDLQEADPEVQELMEKRECKCYEIFKNKDGIILALKKGVGNIIPVVVKPTCLRKELVELSHFGLEKTADWLSTVSWWPGM
ncbi:unnamed protein product [Lepidochelys kempii]